MKRISFVLFFAVLILVGVYLHARFVPSQEELKITTAVTTKDGERSPVPVNMAVRVAALESSKVALALKAIKQNARKPSAQSSQPKELVENPLFAGTAWKIWPVVRAIAKEKLTAADQVVSRLSRYRIVEFSNSQVDLNQFDKSALPVVYDSRLKHAGVVSGFIKIETDRKDLLEKSLEGMDAYINDSFEAIQTYFVTSHQTVFDLERLYENLKVLPFTKSIEIDILDRDYAKK